MSTFLTQFWPIYEALLSLWLVKLNTTGATSIKLAATCVGFGLWGTGHTADRGSRPTRRMPDAASGQAASQPGGLQLGLEQCVCKRVAISLTFIVFYLQRCIINEFTYTYTYIHTSKPSPTWLELRWQTKAIPVLLPSKPQISLQSKLIYCIDSLHINALELNS